MAVSADPRLHPADPDDRARIVGWLRDVARDRAQREIPVPGGVALMHGEFPSAHDHNELLLWSAVDAADVAAAAESVLGGAGLSHRLVEVLDADLAASLAQGLRARGYSRSDQLLMTCSGSRRLPVRAERTAPEIVTMDVAERSAVAAGTVAGGAPRVGARHGDPARGADADPAGGGRRDVPRRARHRWARRVAGRPVPARRCRPGRGGRHGAGRARPRARLRTGRRGRPPCALRRRGAGLPRRRGRRLAGEALPEARVQRRGPHHVVHALRSPTSPARDRSARAGTTAHDIVRSGKSRRRRGGRGYETSAREGLPPPRLSKCDDGCTAARGRVRRDPDDSATWMGPGGRRRTRRELDRRPFGAFAPGPVLAIARYSGRKNGSLLESGLEVSTEGRCRRREARRSVTSAARPASSTSRSYQVNSTSSPAAESIEPRKITALARHRR